MKLLLLLAAICGMVATVSAHGYLADPMARQV